MSLASPRRLATVGSVSLALALAAPAAAFADPGDDRGQGQGRGPAPQSTAQAKPASSPQATTSSSGKAGSSSKSGSSSKGSTSGKSGSEKPTPQRTKPAGGDPRGNNGTVKIDGLPLDDGRGNEPHVGCTFAVDFYGFDKGDTATITFTGQAPTGGGLLHTERATISDDAAGGGQDVDATLVFSVQDQLSELLAIAPHAQQGWHVKLAVDVDSAPGGAKQKVFWIDCPPSAGVSGTTTAPASGGGDTTVTKKSVATTDVGSTEVAAPRRALPLSAEAPTFGSGSTELSGTSEAAANGSAQQVTAQSASRPSVLPFTGGELVGLIAAGLAALGAGAVAVRAGRRRTETAEIA